MPNRPGQPLPDPIRRGATLRADFLNRIVKALVSRITGGPGINISSTGRDVVISSIPRPTGSFARQPILAEIATEVGGGSYTWTKFEDASGNSSGGPDDGDCKEMNDSTGILPGTRVVLHKVGDTYYFFYPVEVC